MKLINDLLTNIRFYNKRNNKKYYDKFKQILLNCEYKICIINSSTPLNKIKKIGESKIENLLNVHGFIIIFDRQKNIKYRLELIGQDATGPAIIQFTIINNNMLSRCVNKESDYFLISEKYIDTDINQTLELEKCDLKGNLINFLWKYLLSGSYPKHSNSTYFILLPYPKIKYNFFGHFKFWEKDYRKKINCQTFIGKMFGSNLIRDLFRNTIKHNDNTYVLILN